MTKSHCNVMVIMKKKVIGLESLNRVVTHLI